MRDTRRASRSFTRAVTSTPAGELAGRTANFSPGPSRCRSLHPRWRQLPTMSEEVPLERQEGTRREKYPCAAALPLHRHSLALLYL